MILERSATPLIQQALREFPVVLITGPRQAGKTTLLKHLLKQYTYINLDGHDIRNLIQQDPRGFLEAHPNPLIFDEIQNVPDLFPYIKDMVDQRRSQKGSYVLTGSQNILLSEKVSESLAGRCGVIQLLPLSIGEAQGHPHQFFLEKEVTFHSSMQDTLKQIVRGFYPEIVVETTRSRNLWYSSYIQTYLERDIRSMARISDLGLFQTFIKLLATRSAQILNMSAFATDLGVSVNTIKSWLSLLESTYQILILRPYFANHGKRLIKNPKVFLTDTGMLCYFLNINTVDELLLSPFKGAIIETAVIANIYKSIKHFGYEASLYFWRTAAGSEIDLLIETKGQIIPLEVKATATLPKDTSRHIRTFSQDYNSHKGYIACLRENPLALSPTLEAIPISKL
jgi:uncharacterized protein